MKSYQAVLFDMDGTVLDTLDQLTASLAHVYSTHGLSVCTRAVVRASLGYGYRGLINRTAPDKTEAEQALLADEFKQWYSAHCTENTRPYAGIPELLQALKENGRKTAIVSNKGQAAVRALHDDFFQDLVAFSMGESPRYCKKPEPDMVWAALDRLHCDKKDTVYIGDSEVDSLTARNAGLDVILVSWGFRDKDFLERLMPDYLAESPQALKHILLG